MISSPYDQLDKLIDEYEEDSRRIRSDTFMMRNYPKLFVMSAASLFEKQVKKRCADLIEFPLAPIDATYPTLHRIMTQMRSRRTIVDSIFGRFYTINPQTQQEDLRADQFYLLFGASFKTSVESNFNAVLANRIAIYENKITTISAISDQEDYYEKLYVKYCEVKDGLDKCTFIIAERAFLTLKLKRNRVAHDFTAMLNDSFNEIKGFYLDALVYVMAVEQAVLDLTDTHALNLVV